MTHTALPTSSMSQRLNELHEHALLIMSANTLAPQKFKEVFSGAGIDVLVSGAFYEDSKSLVSSVKMAFDLKTPAGVSIWKDSVFSMDLVTNVTGKQHWEVCFNESPIFTKALQDRSENNKLPENQQKPIKDGSWVINASIANVDFTEAFILSAHNQSCKAAAICLQVEMQAVMQKTRSNLFTKAPDADASLDSGVEKATKISNSVDSFLKSLRRPGSGPQP